MKSQRSARDRMAEAPPAEVVILDPTKAARLGAKTMLMPSPQQLKEAIEKIPFGHTITLMQARKQLAAASQAEMTCPVATRNAWVLVAEAAEQDREEGITPITAWWRITKDRSPFQKLPGGESRHRELLLEEGVEI